MKNYEIIITEVKSKKIIDTFTELSNTKKYLTKKYNAKIMFEKPKQKVTIKRLLRTPGIQLSLI